MPDNIFQFKQFLIKQNRSVFKVGTDSVLLGAWVDITRVKKILDVGTGTGLIALMVAQRSEAEIHAVEIDETSVLQAGENISNSPWTERIRLFHASFQDFVSDIPDKYDLVVINPPYFTDSYKSPDPARSLSRHHVSLSLHDLLKSVGEILDKSGKFALVMPVSEGEKLLGIVNDYGLYLKRKTDVLPVKGKGIIRYLMEFTNEKEVEVQQNELIIQDRVSHQYTSEYKELTRDFYINF
jgi:tRNA1Val (adenine37-N6)-methyltransferase